MKKRYAFTMTIQARNGQLFEVLTTYTATSERTARLRALIEAQSIGHSVLNIELNKRGAEK